MAMWGVRAEYVNDTCGRAAPCGNYDGACWYGDFLSGEGGVDVGTAED